ncbi:MAG: TetR/AcrR family transcriptional regulator [Acidimicrobiales bacterium]
MRDQQASDWLLLGYGAVRVCFKAVWESRAIDDERTDPRIARTRLHVLAHARRLLTDGGLPNVSFTNLAREARVARQTLYTHWQTPEKLIAEAILDGYDEAHPKDADSIEAAVRMWLANMRSTLSDPSRGVALTTLAASAYHDQTSLDALRRIELDRFAAFNALLLPFGVRCELSDFSLISGPIFANLFFLREPVSDAMIERITSLLSPVVASASLK